MHAGEPMASTVHRNLCLGSEQQGSPSVFTMVVGERGVRGGGLRWVRSYLGSRGCECTHVHCVNIIVYVCHRVWAQAEYMLLSPPSPEDRDRQ